MNAAASTDWVADHVCIGVPDLDQAIAWYDRVLGFEVDLRWTVPELPGFRLAYIRKGNFRIELIDSGDAVHTPVQPMAFEEFLRLPGFSHVCFRVPDVDAASDAIRQEGVAFELEPTDFPDVGRRVAFFRDVFGNFLELAGPMKDKG
ncbi:MAG: VOC family protein [Myxococcota bacterium]